MVGTAPGMADRRTVEGTAARSRPRFTGRHGAPTWIDVWAGDARPVLFAHGERVLGTPPGVERLAGRRPLMAHPLVKDTAGTRVLGLLVAGPGSGLSEEPALGCEPVALGVRVVARCPPGPVAAEVASVLVGQHAGVHDVGQTTFQGAHRHHGRCATGLSGVVELAALEWGCALDDGHDVQRPVDPGFPSRDSGAAVERRRWRPGVAVPFQEANRSLSRKRWMSPRSASSLAAPVGPDPGQLHQGRAAWVTSAARSFSAVLILRSIASSSVTSSTASRRGSCRPGPVGLVVAIRARACGADRNCLAPRVTGRAAVGAAG